MAKSLQGTKTEMLLAASFEGECSGCIRYQWCANKARKEGYEKIAAIFEETAENEKQHGKIFLRYLEGCGPVVGVQTKVEVFPIRSTLENLKCASESENTAGTKTYQFCAKVAEEEGFPEIAATWRMIAEVEVEHGKRLGILAKQLESGTLFKREKVVEWKCRNCGYIIKGAEAPLECPACHHPQSFMEIKEVLE